MRGLLFIKRIALAFVATIGLHAQGVAYTVNASGPTSLTYNGGSNLIGDINFLGVGACLSWNGGACTGGSWGSESFSNAGPVYSEKTFTNATGSLTTRVTYTGAGTNTLTQTILFTNNHATQTCRPQMDLIGIQFGTSITSSGTNSGSQWSGGTPMQKLAYGSSSMYVWYTPLSEPLAVAWENYSGTKYKAVLNTQRSLAVGNTTEYENVTVPPLGTVTIVLNFRFGTSTETDRFFVPEAYSNMAAFAPFLTPGADRRPIARMILASSSNRNAATNPRGWAFGTDPIGDPTQFRTAAISAFNTALALANAQAIRPSTIILWDIEGQEFDHAFSYVGFPNRISFMAPEMDTIIDELVQMVRDAGYEPGLTIRPNDFLYGTSLPGSCVSNPGNASLADIYVRTDVAPPLRGYLCTNGAGGCSGTVDGNWCQEGNWKPGAQTIPNSIAGMTAVMAEKIQYSITRWGITRFYMDSNPSTLREIFTSLNAQFPNVLIFPEHRWSMLYPFLSGYSGDQPTTPLKLSDDVLYVWPYAWQAAIPFNWPISSGSEAEFLTGMAQGSTGVYDIRGAYEPVVEGITLLQQQAAALNATVAMTDRGQARTFKSAPGTSFTYPVTARVYFADTANNLTASTTYCTRKATDSCYLAGVLQSTAALDLSALPYSQIRYYDFAGNQVSEGPYATLQ